MALMNRIGFIVTFALIFTLGSRFSAAQIRIIPGEKVAAVSEPRLSADSAALAFESTHIVAKPMNEDDQPATFVFRVTNVSERVIDITRLVSTCSCASATASRMKVASGDSAEIIVRYDPKGHPGKFQRKVFVYTGEKEPSAVLRLTVDVRNGADISNDWPVQMGCIRLRRAEVSFDADERAVGKLRFINLDDRSISLECDRFFLPECLSFRTEPETVGPGMEGEIVLSYDPSGKGARETMKVIINGLGVPPGKSSITVKLKSE